MWTHLSHLKMNAVLIAYLERPPLISGRFNAWKPFMAACFLYSIATAFTFFCGKKSNKKSRPKTIYSPFSGAALLGSSAW
jgi:hypothetical protein